MYGIINVYDIQILHLLGLELIINPGTLPVELGMLYFQTFISLLFYCIVICILFIFLRPEIAPAEYRLWKFSGKWTKPPNSICDWWQTERKTGCWISTLAQSVCRATVNVFRLYHVRIQSQIIYVSSIAMLKQKFIPVNYLMMIGKTYMLTSTDEK